MSVLLNSKKVISYCKNYYNIIEEHFTQDDNITREIFNYYKKVIETTNVDDSDELSKAISFDECVYAYFNDKKYSKIVLSEIVNFEKQNDLLEFMIESYKKYKENPTNKVTTTKWL